MHDLKPKSGSKKQQIALHALMGWISSPYASSIDKRFLAMQGIFDRLVTILMMESCDDGVSMDVLQETVLLAITDLCKKCESNFILFCQQPDSIYSVVRSRAFPLPR